MVHGFRAHQISEHVYWVGAIDWELADFHGYATERGSTYNAYLILAEKITLIDTVKAPFRDELIGRISDVINPEKIDYIISNHSEMDHTGALADIVKLTKPEKVFATKKGVAELNAHFDLDFTIEEVGEGDSLSLGNMDVHFTDTRMVHWPDSMFTYLDADGGILFSNDAFGMHLAGNERYVDEVDPCIVNYEAAKYYANIIWPSSATVLKVLKKVAKMEKPIGLIAPDHGPIWRKDIDSILEKYEAWASQDKRAKAVLVYDTMWGSTQKMARPILEGLLEGGIEVVMLPLSKATRADLATEMLTASTLVVGSPTLNAGMFPSIADVLVYLQGLKPKTHKLNAAIFGSYGWSPGAAKHITPLLEAMGMNIISDPMVTTWVPKSEIMETCYTYGLELAGKIKEDLEG